MSDLGATPGISAPLFNYGLMGSGILVLVFSTGLFQFLKGKAGKLGAVFFILLSLSLISIGVFPENVHPYHFLASVSFFTLIPLALLFATASFFISKEKKLVAFTAALAFIAACAWVIYATNAIPIWHGPAIPETISALAASAWVIAIGLKILGQNLHS